MKIIKLALVSITLLFSCESFSMLPVVDATAIFNLVKQLEQLKKQYDVLNQTYKSSQDQLYQARAITNNQQGHYGYGSLLNDKTYTVNNREWSPDNWQDALKGLSGGNPARYQQLISQYKSNNPTLSQTDFESGSSKYNAVIYQNDINNNQAASVTATYAFNNIKDHIEHIQKISDQIESAPNEKSAVDLNTRMNAEIAYVQVEMLKQMALLNEQKAHSESDRIRYEAANSQFNRLPDV